MRLGLSFFVLLTALGCGDDGRISFGVDRSRTLSSVTDAEVRAACERIGDDVFDLSRRDSCELEALFATATVDDCNAAVDACLAEPEIPEEPFDCSEETAADFAGCEITVGEFEDCGNDTLDSQESFLRSLSCSDVGTPIMEPETPASCRRPYAECPEVFGE